VEKALTGDLKLDLQAALAAGGMKFSADAVAQAEVSLEGGDLVVRAPKTMTLALRDPAVQRVAAQLLGKPIRLRVEADASMKATIAPPREESAADNAELRTRALEHPGVKRFQELFPGAQVRAVRNLSE
jgi:hypothetical protein